jgi:hypothetical protein
MKELKNNSYLPETKIGQFLDIEQANIFLLNKNFAPISFLQTS